MADISEKEGKAGPHSEGVVRRYRLFRLCSLVYASLVVGNAYTSYIVLKTQGVYDYAFGHYLSY
ncbi:hypothetical protein KIPB_006965, partial [Kipferlia bialata]|eukprot:g6965.t1